jgi:hypothetical protein
MGKPNVGLRRDGYCNEIDVCQHSLDLSLWANKNINGVGHIRLRKIRQVRVVLMVGISPNRLGDAKYNNGLQK